MADRTIQHPVIDEQLVRGLIAEQFPDWADLDIVPVVSAGTDNYLARLGDELCVRLPKVEWAAGTPIKEYTFGSRFAGLPLKTPTAQVLGRPGCNYPWSWTVCDWIGGEALGAERFTDQTRAARILASFIGEMHMLDISDGPESGPQNHYRGAHLAIRDKAMRGAISGLELHMETEQISRLWQSWLDELIHAWQPAWLHGDLHGGNVLIDESGLVAIIDFGLIGVGDAACDLMAGWTLFDADARKAFSNSMHVSDADWLRGAAWALSVACIGLAYYKETNADIAARSKCTIEQVMADFI